MKWAADEFTGKRFGKYEVLCRLAVGGMAEIFLGFARQGPFLGKPVVLKRILAEQREDPQALQMLIDEAKLTATLSHQNVAQVLDLELAGEDVLLVIEFIQGANVEEIVDNYKAKNELVPLGFAVTVMAEAAKGLGHAHGHKRDDGKAMPIIHRDVTPRNIMIDFDGTSKMLDFGIARAVGSQRRTVAGMVRGTTAYMSPEQAIGKDLDVRTDLFSMGTIFYELLVGQRLFYRGNPGAEMAAVYEGEIVLPSKANRRVPKQLDAVVMKALERNPSKRYQSAAEFIRDIGTASAGTTWTRERCAEVVRERFNARRQDVLRLLGRIPMRELGSATEPGRVAAPPAYPQGRTVVSPMPRAPSPATDQARAYSEGDDGRTQVGPQPTAPPAASPSPVQGVVPRPRPDEPEAHTDPVRAAKGLSEAQLFGDIPDEPEGKTSIVSNPSAPKLPKVAGMAGPSLKSLPMAPSDTGSGVDTLTLPPREGTTASGGSKAGLVGIAIAAILVGAVGGAFVFKKMQAKDQSQAPRSAQWGKLTLTATRPVEVFCDGESLGTTPLNDLRLPAGKQTLELLEVDGTKLGLDVDVPPKKTVKVDAALDTLKKLP